MCAGRKIEELELASQKSNLKELWVKDCEWAGFYWGCNEKQWETFGLENVEFKIVNCKLIIVKM